jgi:hypothetical protein
MSKKIFLDRNRIEERYFGASEWQGRIAAPEIREGEIQLKGLS